MIQNPYLLAASFLGLAFFVKWARTRPGFAWAFHYLPVPFWCYFLPMVAATFRFFPSESPLYKLISTYILPVCLPFLLINVDLRSLVALGRPALVVMAAGMAGIMTGSVAGYALLHRWLPPDAWRSVAALSASWTGGSANMLAVKEALSAPESVFAPVVVVDTFGAYGWMAWLIFLAGFEKRFNALNGADAPSDKPARPLAAADSVIDRQVSSVELSPRRTVPWAAVPAAAVCLGLLSVFIGRRLPELGSILSRGTWTILIVTTLSLLLSLTGFFSKEPERTERTGTTLLYILLVSMGARANLVAIWDAPLFLVLGLILLTVHASFLLAAGRWLKAPLSLLATSSQACVGGTVSTPMVAAVFRPALAPLGLMLAIFGNVVGTYLGLVTASLCRMVVQ